ncbi:MAG: PaaI family thioesterase, partial [Flavobacteriales bacterium]|nr:PaaI family thioesterase [Flavobacteriales bacterium]
MPNEDQHLNRLDTVFSKARINARLYPSAKLNTGDGTAEIILDIADSYHHGMGAVHGSVYFKMLDDAAYFAANSAVTDFFLVTTSFNIHMLRAVSSGRITAKG